jgi:hypothetical protein
MNQRREVLRGLISTTVATTLAAGKPHVFSTSDKRDFSSARPAPSQRKFSSRAVETKIAEVKRAIADPELAWLFENCFPNTLDTTVILRMRDGLPYLGCCAENDPVYRRTPCVYSERPQSLLLPGTSRRGHRWATRRRQHDLALGNYRAGINEYG